MSQAIHPLPIATPKPSVLAPANLGLQAWALCLLRVVAGFTFAIYGAQLLFGVFGGSGNGRTPFSEFWFAGILEFFGGLLIGLGTFTRPVAFLLSGEMAFAFFLAHFPQGWNPASNGGETSVLFCFVYLYLSAAGPGRLSLGRLLGTKE
jgi:putative oxidoreductase